MAQFIENLYHGTSDLHEGKLQVPLFVTIERECALWFSVDRMDTEVGGVLLKGNLAVENILDITESYTEVDKLLNDLGIEFKREPYFNCDKISAHSPYDGTNDADIFYIPEVQAEMKRRGVCAIKLFDTFLNSEALTYIVLDTEKFHVHSAAKISMENDVVVVGEDKNLNDFRQSKALEVRQVKVK